MFWFTTCHVFYNSKRNDKNETKKKEKKTKFFLSHKMSEEFSGKKKRKKKPEAKSDQTDENYELALKSIYKKPGVTTKCEKLTVEQPIILPVGTKRTAFVNLVRVCKSMEREPSHFSKFLEVVLGTKAFVTSEGKHVVKGRFKLDQIKSVTSNYVREYVLCPECKLHKTKLVKEGRLTFLQCKMYHTKQSLKTIEMGYVANTRKKDKIAHSSNYSCFS